MKEKIIIFDTTLRDGDQSLQHSLKSNDKLKIAKLLEKMGVDIIEAGFPISSPEDFKSVNLISKNIKNSTICSLARCKNEDIDIAAKAMSNSFSRSFRIHLFIGTSNLHIKYKLRKNFEEILEMAINSVKRAKKYTNDIEFSCEDAGRTNIDNLCIIIENVIKHGVTTINIPDTVGYNIPTEFSKIIKLIINKVPNIDKSIISIHCHNDLGMAAGNSITAIQSGARQIEGTINGIGERSGNTALEEIIMAIKTRKDILNFYTDINHKKIYKTSKIISKICNVNISPNKSIIGSNAFSHSSGIHQDGILKNRKNYEIISPETIGAKNKEFNLTSRSGRAAIKYHMNKMGYSEDKYNLNKLYKNFIKLTDKYGRIFSYDLEALAFLKNFKKESNYFKLKHLKISIKNNVENNILIKLVCGENTKICSIKTKSNIIYAICKIFSKTSNIKIKLKKFKSIFEKDKNNLINKVSIIILYKKNKFYGEKITSNFIESYTKSIVNVLNSIWKYNKIIR
ncbi:2-isopropylmalate synthase (plasmid) [Buchnera aphidicola (Ceratoglyphina bambusae)]|uniref:2-isopropylmalate synthase n=1 Tax=Buchnera aphidicola TaxID=9 RepID=UPI0031B7FE3C